MFAQNAKGALWFGVALGCWGLCVLPRAHATQKSHKAAPRGLIEELGLIRARVSRLQEGLIDGIKSQKAARQQIARIRALSTLQAEERRLSEARIKELESTVSELEKRRGLLKEKITS